MTVQLLSLVQVDSNNNCEDSDISKDSDNSKDSDISKDSDTSEVDEYRYFLNRLKLTWGDGLFDSLTES